MIRRTPRAADGDSVESHCHCPLLVTIWPYLMEEEIKFLRGKQVLEITLLRGGSADLFTQLCGLLMPTVFLVCVGNVC